MFNNNPDFYPTPPSLIHKMLSDIDFRYISSVLEPSSGKGDLVEAVIEKLKYSHSYSYNMEAKWDIDCIEKDDNLIHVLKGKKYRVVDNNFLTYDTYKKYDIIVMNPPFSEGDKHLLKALDMQEQNGGKIVCLLNAETLKNPYSNIRKDLLQRLEKHNASIEYIDNAFVNAERNTNVSVALVRINIEKPQEDSTILEELRQQEHHRAENSYNSGYIVNGDFIKRIIEQYNFEVKAGLKLISEYNALKPYMLKSLKDDCTSTVLQLVVDDRNSDSSLENTYIKNIRMKYWEALFKSEQFMGLFTSNLRQKYYNMISELKDYDFSMYNIYTIKIQLNKEMMQGVEDTILALFEEFSNKHYWDKSNSSNIHYYNGWKSNSSYKINRKIIIPLAGFRDLQYSWGCYEPSNYKVVDKLSDIEKVFNYLQTTEEIEHINLNEVLKSAEQSGETKKIKTTYFYIDFYKKGTVHLTFINDDLLHRFNIFGSRKKGWLPPSYGKSSYKTMTKEEKQIIDSFEGEDSYSKVMNNTDYYIVETSKLLMLA